MKSVNLYTDGACSFNPGPGGWGAILEYKGIEKEMHGSKKDTTNNQMEITAVLKGLAALNEPCEVTIYTDSAYVLNTFEKGWIYNWLKNGWRNSQKKPVENKELWEQMLKLIKPHKVNWVKVKGHSGHEYNERCDALARQGVQEIS